jgi:hypothetical protein
MHLSATLELLYLLVKYLVALSMCSAAGRNLRFVRHTQEYGVLVCDTVCIGAKI